MKSASKQNSIIAILCSTYNGALYIDKLLDSITKQTYNNWELFIRDDGSIDETRNKIYNWQIQFPTKIHFHQDNHGNLGVIKSFEKLLTIVESDYYMFCDQDDFWLPEKIQKTFDRMLTLEQTNTTSPILIFSNLYIADDKLNIIHNSFWKYSKINPDNATNLYKLAINNPVVGCTIMINRRAKIISLPIPEKAIMHDWWIALKVAQQGIISPIKESTILYRQHVTNTVGATFTSKRYYFLRLTEISEVIKQNIDSYNMLKLVYLNTSPLKFIWFKILITITKFCN